MFTGVSQSHRIAREEIFGPVLSVLTFRTPEEAVAKANNTPYGLSAGVWTEKGSRILWMAAAAAGGRGLGQHLQPVRPGQPVRRLPGVRLRAGGRPARAGRVPQCLTSRQSPAAQERCRLDVRKTYKLFIGGAFPRSESGRSYPVTAPTATCWPTPRRPRARTLATPSSPRAARSRGWSGATAYNRGQVLYRVAEMMEGRAAQFAAEVAAAEGLRRRDAEAAVAAAIDRWVWYAGWTDKVAQVAGAANPVAGPYFNFSVPEPTGVVAVLAPAESSLLGLVSVLAPVIVDRQHGGRGRERAAAAAGGRRSPRCSPPPTCRPAWSTC